MNILTIYVYGIKGINIKDDKYIQLETMVTTTNKNLKKRI